MNFRDRVNATKEILRQRLEDNDVSATELAAGGKTRKYLQIFHPVPYQSALGASRVKIEEYLAVAFYELRKEEKEKEKDSTS